MIGRFLEISIPVDDILTSIAFYEKLGFVQAATGETWPHPYAVLTDGRLYIGLHQSSLPALALTYVQPDLVRHAERLRTQGFDLIDQRLDGESFNQASLLDPTGQRIMLVEARTFSPPLLDHRHESLLGYFAEYGLPVRDFEPASSFWESLGFISLDETRDPFPRRTLTTDRLNVGLYRTRALRLPVLTFQDADMRRRLDGLRRKGIELLDDMPDSLDAATNAVIRAPEGTRLLLLSTETDGTIGQHGLQ
jgi:catechol 2,3-dioxygenase-like lactoylglutathione lyase family enzyme